MIFVYSGAPSPNASSNADQSLGGFISNTLVPSGMLDNLFSEISKSAVQANNIECKLLVFTNNSNAALTGFKIWTDLPSSSATNYDNTVTYTDGQYVIYNSLLYICKVDTVVGNPPPDCRYWILYTPLFTVQLATVLPVVDTDCNRSYFEQISSPNQLPLQAEFGVYEGVANALVEDDLPVGGTIGIWIQRNFTAAARNTNSVVNDGGCDDASIEALEQQDKNPLAIATNGFNLTFSWN